MFGPHKLPFKKSTGIVQELAALNIFCSMLYFFIKSDTHKELKYRGADMSLARPGRKQANASVRMA